MAKVQKKPDNPIIVALDGKTVSEAVDLARILRENVWGFKFNDLLDIGMFGALKPIFESSVGAFTDPKLHDIPSTVKNRIAKLIANFPVTPNMLTVHALGGVKMMNAAVEAAGDETTILGVTILTSHDDEGEFRKRFAGSIPEMVKQLAFDALEAGVKAIVCSAVDLKYLAQFDELSDLIKITPAIRPQWFQELGGQAKERTMTPAEAIELGSDYLVMGRPIIKAEDPVEAVEKTLEETRAAA